MKAEKLSDALSFIDDDILEEAETFRNRKISYKKIWIRVLAIAACLCIAFVGVHGLMNSDLFIKPDSYITFTSTSGRGDTEFKYGSGDVSLHGSDATTTMGTMDESFWYYAQITKWAEGGFYAVITGSECAGGELEQGTKVKVCFEDKPAVIKNIDATTQQVCFEYTPSEKDFPVGSVVKIQLVRVKKCSNDSLAEYELWTGFFGDIAPFQK